jgi:acetyl esterase/lipase
VHSDVVILYLPGEAGRAEQLAQQTGATVAACRYRATFAEALSDVHAKYQECAEAGPVVLVGERMGAALAGSLLVQLRDAGAALPRCAVLVSALLDLTMQAKSLRLNARADPRFDAGALRQQVADYAGGAALTDPLLSPLYANLYGLPPLQLLVAGTDPLLDDSLGFAVRAARSHVPVDLRVLPDTLSGESLSAISDFIRGWAAPVASLR